MFESVETKLKYFHGNEFVAVTFAKTLESSLNYSSIVEFWNSTAILLKITVRSMNRKSVSPSLFKPAE